jgi:hypothetical protein
MSTNKFDFGKYKKNKPEPAFVESKPISQKQGPITSEIELAKKAGKGPVLTLTLEDIDKLLDKKLANLQGTSATNQSKEQILDEFLNELAKLQPFTIKQLKTKSGNKSNADINLFIFIKKNLILLLIN